MIDYDKGTLVYKLPPSMLDNDYLDNIDDEIYSSLQGLLEEFGEELA